MGYQEYVKALQLLSPEMALVVGILFAAIWNLLFPKARGMTPIVSLLSLIASWAVLVGQLTLKSPERLFNGLFTIDPQIGRASCRERV